MTSGTTAPAPQPASYRRIAALAIPALVVLAAEPIYLLIDTAVVGHLGAVPLAGLALGGVIMGLAPLIGAVLAYGTTARAARRFGAGDRAGAVAEGVQGTWIALAAGLAMVVAFQFLAGPVAGLMGDDPAVESAAAEWLRVAVLGAPFLLVAGAGQGWMRAVQDTKRPMWFVSASFLFSAILAPILVYPVGLGLVGSAWANAVAQAISGVLFLLALRRERVPLRLDWTLMSKQLVANGDLIIRGIAFQVSSFSAAAVAARVGTAALGAHQIGMQLWFFAALALDAVAIAGQALIGADLGAGRPEAARASARRLTVVGFGYGTVFLLAVLALLPVLPDLFTSEAAVHEQLGRVWPWLVLLLPVAGVVFALDGVLIGAGDLRFMRNMTVVSIASGLPFTWLTLVFGWGLTGIWGGIAVYMLVRLGLLLWRLRSGAWAVTGAERG
ncbi:MATE family efflux transporter [Glycomyces sp. TRM65418]|uniref:MATE family efflux transporter n=1 Tax=Glycomyces sp. TRM65418 TaxID=2867006 RepID=UPI001CE6EDC9|nr:MATE family efflux transporter [Glycomyces sp. TRM65418]MCC3762174.1 MATE family efflux transporter [Glycomyces sp. TRM65418]QZD56235.1 MATE family efflux transporter [Glycomyces sp. TRM65418]